MLSFAALDRATAYPRSTSAGVYDYHDEHTGVLASSLAKHVPAYTSLGFPSPQLLCMPSVNAATAI